MENESFGGKGAWVSTVFRNIISFKNCSEARNKRREEGRSINRAFLSCSGSLGSQPRRKCQTWD
jgi:hypothetical protein